MTMQAFFAAVITLILLFLMIISSFGYLAGLLVLIRRRAVPDTLGIARVSIFAALVLCAAKNLSPPVLSLTIGGVSILSFAPQLPLSFLVAGASGYAVWQLFGVVNTASQMHSGPRMLLQNWLVLVIPPTASIGLLGLFDAVPDREHSIILYAFVLVNAIPAVYGMINARYLASQAQVFLKR